jgi:hypothetical protein
VSRIAHRSAAGSDRLADAELQADVMRFVAILALCLVGISTLVERAGSGTVQPPATAPGLAVHNPPDGPGDAMTADAANETEAPDSGEPREDPIQDQNMTEPATSSSSPIGLPVGGGAGSVASTGTAGTVAAVPRPASVTEKQEAAPSDRRGLTLRFESDAALLRMVGRGEAGVFVLAGRQVFALDIRRGVEFNPTPSPARIHVITADTVPALLLAEYDGPADATWGVTLPGATLDAMRPHIERGDEGVLVIAEDGSVRLEMDDA